MVILGLGANVGLGAKTGLVIEAVVRRVLIREAAHGISGKEDMETSVLLLRPPATFENTVGGTGRGAAPVLGSPCRRHSLNHRLHIAWLQPLQQLLPRRPSRPPRLP